MGGNCSVHRGAAVEPSETLQFHGSQGSHAIVSTCEPHRKPPPGPKPQKLGLGCAGCRPSRARPCDTGGTRYPTPLPGLLVARPLGRPPFTRRCPFVARCRCLIGAEQPVGQVPDQPPDRRDPPGVCQVRCAADARAACTSPTNASIVQRAALPL
eukprot:2349928-Prymnesium_polylepis.1